MIKLFENIVTYADESKKYCEKYDISSDKTIKKEWLSAWQTKKRNRQKDTNRSDYRCFSCTNYY